MNPRTNRSVWRASYLLVLAVVAGGGGVVAGCGGKVVYTEGGGDGLGSGDDSEPTTIEGACDELCGRVPQCLGDPCEENCALAGVPGCDAESVALLACFAEELPDDCMPSPGMCTTEVLALAQCGGFDAPSP